MNATVTSALQSPQQYDQQVDQDSLSGNVTQSIGFIDSRVTLVRVVSENVNLMKAITTVATTATITSTVSTTTINPNAVNANMWNYYNMLRRKIGIELSNIGPGYHIYRQRQFGNDVRVERSRVPLTYDPIIGARIGLSLLALFSTVFLLAVFCRCRRILARRLALTAEARAFANANAPFVNDEVNGNHQDRTTKLRARNAVFRNYFAPNSEFRQTLSAFMPTSPLGLTATLNARQSLSNAENNVTTGVAMATLRRNSKELISLEESDCGCYCMENNKQSLLSLPNSQQEEKKERKNEKNRKKNQEKNCNCRLYRLSI